MSSALNVHIFNNDYVLVSYLIQCTRSIDKSLSYYINIDDVYCNDEIINDQKIQVYSSIIYPTMPLIEIDYMILMPNQKAYFS